MAEWSKKRVDSSEINGGKEFTSNDNLAINELNAIVNNSFYGVEFVEAMADAPDVSEIDGTGTPSVSLVDNGDFKRFKFSNLRGKQGEKGERGEKGEKGESGESSAMIKILGSISISKQTGKELFELISTTFGTDCESYYLVLRHYSQPLIISAPPTNNFLYVSLTNKWKGTTTEPTNIKSVSTGGTLDAELGAPLNYKPNITPDYVKFDSISFDNYLNKVYNFTISQGGFEIRVSDMGFSTSMMVECEYIDIYGITW